MAYRPDPALGARLKALYHVGPPEALTSCNTCHR